MQVSAQQAVSPLVVSESDRRFVEKSSGPLCGARGAKPGCCNWSQGGVSSNSGRSSYAFRLRTILLISIQAKDRGHTNRAVAFSILLT